MMSTPGASYARAERLERHMRGRKYRPSLARRGEGDGSSCCCAGITAQRGAGKLELCDMKYVLFLACLSSSPGIMYKKII